MGTSGGVFMHSSSVTARRRRRWVRCLFDALPTELACGGSEHNEIFASYQRVGEPATMPFPLHPHLPRHACGFKLANDGRDTRALQHYLVHKTFSTPSGTPKWRPTGSRTFGEATEACAWDQ